MPWHGATQHSAAPLKVDWQALEAFAPLSGIRRHTAVTYTYPRLAARVQQRAKPSSHVSTRK
eukprot:12947859-Alexandrium_andersonii.AAC.1